MTNGFANNQNKRYEFEIISRESILKKIRKSGKKSVTFQGLFDCCESKEAAIKVALKRRLRAMISDNQIVSPRPNRFLICKREDLKNGIIYRIGRRRMAIKLIRKNTMIQLEGEEVQKAMEGDYAEVLIIKRFGKQIAILVRILKRAKKKIFGYFSKDKKVCIVFPIFPFPEQRIFLEKEKCSGLEEGELVEVEVPPESNSGESVKGKLTNRLGRKMTPSLAMMIVSDAYSVRKEWSASLQRELKYIEPELHDQVLQRVDLSDLPFITIDGETASDFDDALFHETTEDGSHNLYVAVADVSSYVKEGSEIDLEAKKRNVSYYFTNNVIPMLPEKLSNNLCSLKAGEKRPVLIVQIKYTGEYRRSSSSIYPAFIKVKSRLTYQQATRIYQQKERAGKEIIESLKGLVNHLQFCQKQRKQRGGIFLSLLATQIKLNRDQEVQSIAAEEITLMGKVVEEAMIVANVAVAEFLKKHRSKGPYRVHEGIISDNLDKLRSFLAFFGIKFRPKDRYDNKEYSRVLSDSENYPARDLIQIAILRSFAQAIYQEKSGLHFGLALKTYTHFTSPIRRYPDLLVHREVYRIIRGQKLEKRSRKELCIESSFADRRAEEVSRSEQLLIKYAFLKEKIGSCYQGILSSIFERGFEVYFPNLGLTGILIEPGKQAGEYKYRVDNTNKAGKQLFLIGDRIAVQIKEVNIPLGRLILDFVH